MFENAVLFVQMLWCLLLLRSVFPALTLPLFSILNHTISFSKETEKSFMIDFLIYFPYLSIGWCFLLGLKICYLWI